MPTKAERIKFGEAVGLFKTEHCAKKKARTRYDYERVLDNYLLPAFAAKKMPSRGW